MPRRPLCNHIDTIKDIRFNYWVSLTVVSIQKASKSVGNKRRNPIVVIISISNCEKLRDFCRIHRPLCNHIRVIFGIRFDLLVSFAVISIPIPSKSVEKKRRTRKNPIVVIISEYFFLSGSHNSAKTSPLQSYWCYFRYPLRHIGIKYSYIDP